MSGICSKHIDYDKDCKLCNYGLDRLDKSTPQDEITCECGFVYFKIIEYCPKCNRERKEQQ